MKMRKRRKAFHVDYVESGTIAVNIYGEYVYRRDSIRFFFFKRVDARKPK